MIVDKVDEGLSDAALSLVDDLKIRGGNEDEDLANVDTASYGDSGVDSFEDE